MKISFLHFSSPPVVGGVESVLASQAEVFRNATHEVQVITGRGIAWRDDITILNLPLIDSRDERILAMKARLDRGKIPPVFYEITDEIYAALLSALHGSDVLIAHNVASLHKNLALTAALHKIVTSRANGLRVILWHHDFAWTAAQYSHELHSGYPWDLTRQAWPGALHVTVSQSRQKEMADLTGFPSEQIHVIPAGLDQGELLALPMEIQVLSSQLGLGRADPIILTPVRITRRKNLELALNILAALKKDLPEAQLIITGPTGAHNPGNLTYLRELISLRKELQLHESVHFLAERYPDGLSYQQIAAFFRLADALLLPSLEEGFGIPVIEAGLSRLMIFCSDLAPLKSLGREWANYFSVEDTPEQIANLIFQRLFSDPLYRLRASVRKEFTWEAIYRNKIEPLLTTQIVPRQEEVYK